MLPTATPGLARAYYDLTFQGGCTPGSLSKRIGSWTGSADGRDKICKFVAAFFTVAIDCLASTQLVAYSKELLAGAKALRSGNSLLNGPAKAGHFYKSLSSGCEMVMGTYDYGTRSDVENNAHRLYILAGIVSLSAFMVMFVAYRPISVFKKFTSIPYFPAVTPKDALRGFMMAATVNHLATVIQYGAVVWEAGGRYNREANGADQNTLNELGHKYYEKVAPACAKMTEKTGDLGRDALFFGLFAANWYVTSVLLLGTASLSIWGTWAKTFDSRAAEAARAA